MRFGKLVSRLLMQLTCFVSNSNYLKGDAFNSIYAYRYAGLTENGDPSVYDENGDIKANEPVRNINALVCAGQLTPKWNGALTSELEI